MIITLTHTGDVKVVSSALYKKCTELTSILIINTEDKGVPWDYVMSSEDYLKVEYCHGDNISQVWVYSENDEEKKIIHRTRYELLSKNQLQLLFIDDRLIGG